eukprot:TRINITY_DN761_c0_g1_i1.p1 TRINITY_DN761_c0_g1~~TRINITY_DN761_c0_g1_i1.p1  ORF type:complete len:235 (-),score=104.60 TRINITY_DN761_c0_g1_i1:139-819(-)
MIKKQRAVINFETVDGVPLKKTISLVNNFVLSTTQFINRFAYLCEKKLAQVSKDVDNLELVLSLLEAKLQSIPGLEGVTPATVAAPAASAPPAEPQASSSSNASPAVSASPPPDEVQPLPATASQPPPNGQPPNKENPLYVKYFKMLSYKVPMPQIVSLMRTNGVDPDILNDPDGYAVAGMSSSSSQGRGDDDDDEEEEEEEKVPSPPSARQDEEEDDEKDEEWDE